MARRRQEIALQTEIETQEEWTQMINKEGLTGDCCDRSERERGVDFLRISTSHFIVLTVIDVYQQWAGPCKSVEGNFKRIKLETGEQMLKFALVMIMFPNVFISTN